MTGRFLLATLGLLASPALASGQDLAVLTSPEAPAVTARCIVARLDHHAQHYTTADGRHVVSAFAPRGRTNRWIVTPSPSGATVDAAGAIAGFDHHIRSHCYR